MICQSVGLVLDMGNLGVSSKQEGRSRAAGSSEPANDGVSGNLSRSMTQMTIF